MVFSHPPHAILLIEGYISDSDNYIKNYLSQIVTDHGGDQQYLQKIANNTYYDMICLDCYTTSLKKEDVLTIIDRFQQQASEALGLKFYIIKGIENSSKEAINSLLKFIEEPLNNIYAVFTTRNVKAVVGTITSRCEQVIIKSDFTQLDLLIQKYNLTTEQVAIIKKVYWNITEIKNDLANENFLTCFNFMNDLLNNSRDFIKIKLLSDEFNSFNPAQIKLALHMISTKKNSVEILQIYDQVKLHSSNILVFNQLLENI